MSASNTILSTAQSQPFDYIVFAELGGLTHNNQFERSLFACKQIVLSPSELYRLAAETPLLHALPLR